MSLASDSLPVQHGTGYYTSQPPFPLLLILLVSPCHINFLFIFLQQQIQNISNQTFNQLLLQNYQSFATEPEANESQLYANGQDQVCPKDFNAPIQQEVD